MAHQPSEREELTCLLENSTWKGLITGKVCTGQPDQITMILLTLVCLKIWSQSDQLEQLYIDIDKLLTDIRTQYIYFVHDQGNMKSASLDNTT